MNTVVQLKPIYRESLEDQIEELRNRERQLTKDQKEYSLLKAKIISGIGEKTEVVNSLGHVIAELRTNKHRSSFDWLSRTFLYEGCYRPTDVNQRPLST